MIYVESIKFSGAYDAVAGKDLDVTDGTFQVDVPATHMGVVELTQ